MNLSFLRFGISCCRDKPILSEGKLDPMVSQDEIGPVYDKLSGIYDIWGRLTESRARDRAIELAAIEDGQDILRWLLESRFGGDAEYAKEYLDKLREVRDGVLNHRLKLGDGAVLLDVGAGDGLIGFGALDRLGPNGRVIFSDISRSRLDHCRSLAAQMTMSERCEFVEARAEDLRPIADDTVDAVTTRSVLIYVADKAAAFREFHRVLKPGGQISLFEPINRYGLDAWRFDVTPVSDLAQRLRDFYRRLQPPDSDPMLDFDEHGLVALCEATGFVDIHLALHIFVRPATRQPWDRVISIPGNPNIPSLGEAMAELFTPEEATRYETHVRPRVEAGHGVVREAVAYLAARKPEREAPTPLNAGLS